MRVFVTGSTGLLGSNLTRLLVREGHAVTALVRDRSKAERLLGDLPLQLVEGDVQHVPAFEHHLTGCEVLFHTAAYFRESFQPGQHADPLEAINVRGTMALLEAAERQHVGKVIYTSSSGVIGMRPGQDWGDETDPPDAIAVASAYFRSKIRAEAAVASFLERSDLPVVQILPGWMFGPGDAAPTASGQIVLDYLNRRLPAVIAGGGAPVDARDVAAAMLAAVDRGASGERYIVGGDRFVDFAELLHELATVSGIAGPRLRLPLAATLVVAWLSETAARLRGVPTLITVEGVRTLSHRRTTRSAKAQRDLGVTFRPLRETLRDEVAWYRQHQPERLTQLALQSQPATVP
jgi:dihydroflavonol-4-reductase